MCVALLCYVCYATLLRQLSWPGYISVSNIYDPVHALMPTYVYEYIDVYIYIHIFIYPNLHQLICI